MDEVQALSGLVAYAWAALGVALSVLIPVVSRALAQAFPSPGLREKVADAGGQRQALWVFLRPYLLVGVFSLMVAVLIVAFVDFETVGAALIGGYAWDATLQKIRNGVGK